MIWKTVGLGARETMEQVGFEDCGFKIPALLLNCVFQVPHLFKIKPKQTKMGNSGGYNNHLLGLLRDKLRRYQGKEPEKETIARIPRTQC